MGYYPYATASASAADSHSTNSTWEDIVGMSVAITPSATAKLLVLFTCESKITSNYDGVRFRADLDGASQSEAQGHQNYNVASPNNEIWHLSMHFVLEGVSAAAHIVKIQWQDNGNGGNCDITNRRMTVIAFTDEIKTVYASAADAHTTNNTWEDVNSMTLTFTLAAQADIICMGTINADPNSLNWEHFKFRFDLDGTTQSEEWLKSRDDNYGPLEQYSVDFHTVFANAAAGSHTVKIQWHDNNSSMDIQLYERRLTCMWHSDNAVTAVATAPDAHTNNSVTEPVNSMSCAYTPSGTEDVVLLYSQSIGGTSANWEYFGTQIAISGGATGTVYKKQRDSNPTSSEKYLISAHEVFTSVAALTTFIANWTDLTASLNVSIGARRLTVLPVYQSILPSSTHYPPTIITKLAPTLPFSDVPYQLFNRVVAGLAGKTVTPIDLVGSLALKEKPTAHTIATGVITLTEGTGMLTTSRSAITVDTQAAAATDDLDTINGGRDGHVLVVRATDDTHTIVLKNGTGNIVCIRDISLSAYTDLALLVYNSTLSKWLAVEASLTAHEAAADPHPGYLTPAEHTAIGDGSPHHARAHVILDSNDHTDTLTGTVVDGDVIIGNVTPKWSKLAITVPAANILNVLGVANGELRPSWKATHDATNPTTIGVSDAAAPGTSLISSHRDHQHGSPATFPATAHNVLSATHGDTTAAAVVRGDLITGQGASPKWVRLALPAAPPAGFMNVLGEQPTETEPTWHSVLDNTDPVNVDATAAAPGTSLIFSHRDHRHLGHAAVTLAADIAAIASVSGQDLSLDDENPNIVFAGPASGPAADPTFRSLVVADLPSLTSAQLATLLSDEVGTDKVVFNTSPTLITPTLGVATATRLGLGVAAGGTYLLTFPNNTDPTAGATFTSLVTKSAWYQTFQIITRAATPSYADFIFSTDSTGANTRFMFYANSLSTALLTIQADGSVIVGAPTGGAKGAGTINAQGVYDDNTLLTDYVFEAEYKALSIPEMKKYYERNLHLPTIPGRDEWNNSGQFSLGKIATHIWETVEVHGRYIAELEERLARLETKYLD